jgi:hypothetical protein
MALWPNNQNIANIIKTHKVAMSGSSAQSGAMLSDTSVVTVWADVDCWIARGVDPTAAATAGTVNIPIPSYSMVEIIVDGGSKIAGIGTGNLYIWERR